MAEFCDSFAHYDTEGIPLKYSTAGGSIQNNLAHVRTGFRSLEIQAGDAPSILNFALPPDVTQTYSTAPTFEYFALGFAYQADALNGTIFTLKRNLSIFPTPAETLLYLVLNADGSLSLFTDGGTLLGSSAVGVITANTFYYITLSADLSGVSGGTFATVNITDAALVSTDVIAVTGFTLADTLVDEFDFGGPGGSDHAWVNDFYFQSLFGGTTIPLAPHIYACLPNGDGTPLTAVWDNVIAAIWEPLSMAHFPLIDSVPQDETQGLQFPASPQYAPSPPNFITFVSQTFDFDCTALPNGQPIHAIQAVLLTEYDQQIPGVAVSSIEVAIQDSSSGNIDGTYNAFNTAVGQAFLFGLSQMPLDIFGNPWTVADWKAGRWQAGPITISSS
jgi:hypothetical protein